MGALQQALLMVGGSSGTPPDLISGLVFWIDATDTSLLLQTSAGAAATADTDPVGLAKSKDATGTMCLYQGTAGDRPLLRTAVINGKSVLRLDGSSDHSFSYAHSSGTVGSQASQNTLLGAGTAATAIWAGTVGSNAVASIFVSNRRAVLSWGGSKGPYIGFQTTSGTGTVYGSNTYATIAASAAQVAITPGPLVVSLRISGASVQLRVNGGAWSSVTLSSETFNAAAAIRSGLDGTDTLRTECDTAHLCLFNAAISDADLDSIESFLMGELGI
jgi:hypothetical protein